MRIHGGLLLALALGAATPAGAQGRARYRPSADTVAYLMRNPFRMYWSSAADTVGSPALNVWVETHAWRPAGNELAVAVRQASLDVSRNDKTNVFTVSPAGRVRLVDGKPPALNSRVDVVTPLPVAATALRVGLIWADTLDESRPAAGGTHVFRIERSHRVARELDTLGARVVEIVSTGTVHYRDGWGGDSADASRVWIDVHGPVDERAWFAPARGRLLARSWRMDLRGLGANPHLVQGDTVPAGLRSAETVSAISVEQARLLARALPGAHTSFTVTEQQGAILLHTTAREAGAVRASMARNDGMVGTVTAHFAGARPISYSAVWTDTTLAVVRREISAEQRRVRVQGTHDTTMTAPAPLWAVADYAMDELFVPVLASVPRDSGSHALAIYRPHPGKWDIGQVSIRSVPGAFIATIEMPEEQPSVLLVTDEGDLLFGENSGAKGSRRIPMARSARMARLEELVRTLRGD